MMQRKNQQAAAAPPVGRLVVQQVHQTGFKVVDIFYFF